MSVRDVAESINRSGLGTVFVINSAGALQAAVTDGDIRRALLAGHDLDSPAEVCFNKAFIALEEDADWLAAISRGSAKGLTEYPVVDSDGLLVCVEVRPESVAAGRREQTVVIMAGGLGLRLRPMTAGTPKPLLPVDGKPILQHIIETLKKEGFTDIVIAVNYLGDQIEDFFGDGSHFGVDIRYLRENQPLGTAGALSLLQSPVSNPVVVMNGDLLVRASVGKMVDYHLDEAAEITIGAKLVDTTVPYGVLTTDGLLVTGIQEKPSYRSLVNAGLYVLDRKLLDGLPTDRSTDMPQLIAEHAKHRRVLAFPIHEAWADLGNPEDFARAQELMDEG